MGRIKSVIGVIDVCTVVCFFVSGYLVCVDIQIKNDIFQSEEEIEIDTNIILQYIMLPK